MRRFIARHLDKITGVLEGFDRIVFRGWLGRLCHESGLRGFLDSQGVLLKDFEPFAKEVTGFLRDEADARAASFGDKVHYLERPSISKEMLARKLMQERGIHHGPVAILSAVEPCMTWEVHRSRERKHPQELRRRSGKCLHLYHYFADRRFGMLHVRIQTWFPFQVRVCLNGRDWLGCRLDQSRLRYRRLDNCFPWVASPERAQELMDGFLEVDWGRVLDDLVVKASPGVAALMEQLRGGFYWTVWQSEWATDVMFRDIPSLQECYPAFVQHAIGHLKSPDVLRFLGRRLSPQYRGEVTGDYKRRVEGIRVRHAAKGNSVKMYDKFGSVLRVEATINRPEEFKVRRRAQGDPESPSKLRPLRKGVADLRRLARVGKACTRRYLHTLASVEVDTPLGKIVEPLTQPAEIKGRRVRGLRPWAQPDTGLLEAIARGEFLVNGFRNRDLLPLLFPSAPERGDERRKLSAKITRMLRLLRAHSLIEKVEGTHRYLVTTRGRTAIGAILAARKAALSKLQQCA